MKSFLFCISFSLAFIASIYIADAQAQDNAANWELVREDDSIKVFTRHSTDLKNLAHDTKGEVMLSGNIDSAFVVISDMQKFASTDEVVAKTEKLTKEDERYKYYYQIAKTPFFMQDRDVVLRASSTKTSLGYFIYLETVDDTTLMPLNKGLQRMSELTLYVSIQKTPNEQSFKLTYKMTYRLDEDDYSRIVGNSYNRLAIASTYNRLVNLRELINTELKTGRKP